MHRCSCPTSVRCDNAEAELESVCERRNTLRAAWVLAYNHSLLPIRNIDSYPAGKERLGDKVVDRTLEEALHLRGMEVDGDHMVYAGDVEEISGDGPREGVEEAHVSEERGLAESYGDYGGWVAGGVVSMGAMVVGDLGRTRSIFDRVRGRNR